MNMKLFREKKRFRYLWRMLMIADYPLPVLLTSWIVMTQGLSICLSNFVKIFLLNLDISYDRISIN